MDWFKLDVDFADHPKIIRLSDRAFRVHVVALCWVARHESDGLYYANGTAPRYINELVTAGLWTAVDGGYEIHDWSHYIPSHEITELRRAEARERMARARDVRANKRRTTPEVRTPEVEVEVEKEQDQKPRDRRPEAEGLCVLLADLIESNGSRRPVISERWLDEADRLLRIDGRPVAEAEALIRWSQADQFWRANCVSMVKFRAIYDRLRLKSQMFDAATQSPWEAIRAN